MKGGMRPALPPPTWSKGGDAIKGGKGYSQVAYADPWSAAPAPAATRPPPRPKRGGLGRGKLRVVGKSLN